MLAIDTFLVGERILRKEHNEASKKKLGILRGGNAGCLLPDGTTVGGCPHEALGRFLGYEKISEASQGYFDGGIANEYIWERNAKVALADPSCPYDALRCEEDIPVVHELGKYKITGRPDLVLGNMVDGEFVPKLGTELKGCYAVKSGARKLLGLKPDDKHLCQAAFYMKKVGCKWTIPYTVNVTGELGFFCKKDYGVKELGLGKVEFPIEFRGDTLFYQTIGGTWQETNITWSGILDYYRLIIDMYEKKKVGVTSISLVDALNNEMPYDPNLYNEFTNLVPVNQGWDVFESYAKRLTGMRRLIKYSRGKYLVLEVPVVAGPRYEAAPLVVGKYKTLKRAREEAYEGT